MKNIYRLTKAGAVLAWYGAAFIPRDLAVPGPLRALRYARGTESNAAQAESGDRLSRAMRALGPTYIKLGQFLATRPDVAGAPLATALGSLRDRLPAFSTGQAKAEIEAAFGRPWSEVYIEFSEPVAAASIAQVHKATVADNGIARAVAVKILRPDIEPRFARDLESFYFAAHTLERFSPKARRLRPVAAVDTLSQSVALEMDLRLEAAAISEMAENITLSGDTGFRVPKVDWTRTSRRVLTIEWVDGISLADLEAIDLAGLDREALGLNIIRSFLRHAIRDGFFHADMHQGNLFVDPADGTVIAVDFGIIGRIGPNERRFLAEILYGFLTRNYMRIAEVHFEAGYVPKNQDVAAFAQALRAIAAPIMDRPASEISMGRLLTQLFEVTDMFQMRMRPELLLLQKTMVVVEGVARSLDSRINIWTAAEPVVRDWMQAQLGPAARLRDVAANVSALATALRDAPKLLEKLSQAAENASDDGGESSLGAINVRARGAGSLTLPLYAATAVLLAIAIKLWFF